MDSYVQVLEHNSIPYCVLDSSSTDFWQRLEEVDLFIYRWAQYDFDKQIALSLVPAIEKGTGTPCFPDSVTSWLYDDKVRQQYLFEQAGFDMVPGWVFYDKKKALDFVGSAPLPLVFKLRGGAASENVIMVRSRGEGRRLVKRMFGRGIRTRDIPSFSNLGFANATKVLARHASRYVERFVPKLYWARVYWQSHRSYVYFQKYLPGNQHDTRITVIGDRAFGFRRLVRDGDFRASGSGRIDHDHSKIDMRCVEQAFEISRHFGFKSMAYDFLTAEDGSPAFCEVSYSYVDEVVAACPGYWDRDLAFHEEQLWPAYCILSDLIGDQQLEQPKSLWNNPK